ncbi:Katanin p80 WD40 repeat-containing subunit B1 [Nibea albiflora]|uniref:Katanin p80 WD40 repeat-containing subunit B1 n=1 Tax=Nibea albiflora TaxID=240163 RepID=A0ACB7EJN1_NIBAL|nr:Katanin p80 WD40 repeat-containing subunit B1 [Nibea albiflora]
MSDEEALSQIKKGHDTMCVMLSSRHKNLETVRSVWIREDIKIDKLLQSKYERHQKCRACCKQLKNLSNVVKNKAAHVGRHGSAFKELQLLMAPLDDSL